MCDNLEGKSLKKIFTDFISILMSILSIPIFVIFFLLNSFISSELNVYVHWHMYYTMNDQSDIWTPRLVLFWLLIYSEYRDERKFRESGWIELELKYGDGLVAKSCPTLPTPWTVACLAPLSMGFSRQEYWGGLWFLSLGNLPYLGIEPGCPAL